MSTDLVRRDELKTRYSFVFDDDLMLKAVVKARKDVLRLGYTKVELEFKSSVTEIEVDNYIGDIDFDYTVTKSDVQLLEYMVESPYTVTDISANIDTLVKDHPSGKSYIILDGTYPVTTGNSLKLIYYKMLNPYSVNGGLVEELEEWLFIKYLFQRLDPYKLQQGMTIKKINGKEIIYDDEGIDNFLREVDKIINGLILSIKGIGGFEIDDHVVISKLY